MQIPTYAPTYAYAVPWLHSIAYMQLLYVVIWQMDQKGGPI